MSVKIKKKDNTDLWRKLWLALQIISHKLLLTILLHAGDSFGKFNGEKLCLFLGNTLHDLKEKLIIN